LSGYGSPCWQSATITTAQRWQLQHHIAAEICFFRVRNTCPPPCTWHTGVTHACLTACEVIHAHSHLRMSIPNQYGCYTCTECPSQPSWVIFLQFLLGETASLRLLGGPIK
jgi:hypothetical protein